MGMQKLSKPNKGRVLYVGQCYYNAWYLSRELRKLGWKADVLNFDSNEQNQIYYHGEDFKFSYGGDNYIIDQLEFYLNAIMGYDIFHFSNAWGLYFITYFDYVSKKKNESFGYRILRLFVLFVLGNICQWKANRIARLFSLIGKRNMLRIMMNFKNYLPERWDIKLLKNLGKKIVYSNNGCQDGVSQSAFRKWGPEPVCDICRWRDVPSVCSDEKNLAWGKIRNEMADYQILLGGNHVDYNDDPRVHEVPEFYCLDHNFWNPDLLVPANYQLPYSKDTIKIYHSVGNFQSRTDATNEKNIKCTHIYIPLVESLKSEGYKVELIFFHDVPNKQLRYYQVQADIIVDMLTFGWFGANVREAMMLGKPCICFLRPEWLDQMRKEIPEYVDELPVISATPQTIYDELKDLIEHPEKRKEIGRKSREFAIKWHSAEAGAKRFDKIYSELLNKE